MERYSKNLYKLPVRRGDLEKIATKQSMLSDEQKTHVKNFANSIDFCVPEGSEVFASYDGEVTTVRDDYNEGGPDRKYFPEGNFVVIRHPNNEFSLSAHFRYRRIVVKPGDKIKQGQFLGNIGMTGYTFRPHLHYEVFVWPSATAKAEERETIKARFEDFPNIYEVGE